MRQVFVGRNGANDAAAGTVRLESLNSDGEWVTYAGYAEGQKLRVVQHVNGDIAKRVSPTFEATEVKASNAHSTPPSKQSHLITCTAGGTSGAKATFKFIDTTPGYEPFTRYQVEFVCGNSAENSAIALEAAIDVERAANAKFAAALDAPSITGAAITITAALGIRVEVAADPGDMADALTFTHAKSAGVSGVGDYASVKKMEELQAGREHTNYDQLVTFASMPAQVNAEVGQTYHLTHISFRNNYKGGVGQINGVDNFRDLYVYLEELPTTDIYGAKTATAVAGGWFDDIEAAKLGGLSGTNPFLDD